MQGNVMQVFVSMPYGRVPKDQEYWQRFYTDGIIGLIPLLKGRGYNANFLRPKEEVSALVLKENVRRLLDQCHACLAIITGLNPNVFWEVGYAVAKGKPVLFAVAEGLDETQYSPVLVADALKAYYNGNIFLQTSPDPKLVQDFQYNLIRFLDVAYSIVRGLEKPAPQYCVFADRSGADLPGIVASAEHSIDLITTNLSFFADIDHFVVEVNDKPTYAFDPPVERGVKVRILALDPDSTISSYRAKQLGSDHDVAGYREQLRTAARFFYKRYLDRENVDIRIYDDLPLQITAIVDNRVMTSIVSRGQQARNNIHVGFDLDFKGARATFEKHFAEVLASQAQTSHISRFNWAKK